MRHDKDCEYQYGPEGQYLSSCGCRSRQQLQAENVRLREQVANLQRLLIAERRANTAMVAVLSDRPAEGRDE